MHWTFQGTAFQAAGLRACVTRYSILLARMGLVWRQHSKLLLSPDHELGVHASDQWEEVLQLSWVIFTHLGARKMLNSSGPDCL